MKRLFQACATSLLVIALSSCSAGGGSNSNAGNGGGTVFAQSGYSNGSLIGTYSVSLTSVWAPSSGFFSGIGTLQFNGAGAITSGTLNLYGNSYSSSTPQPSLCIYSATGTYTLQTSALGNATVNLTSTTTGCAAAETWQLALAAGNSGNTVQIARTEASTAAAGSAVKQ